MTEKDVFVYRDKNGAVIEIDAQQPNATENQIVNNSTFVSFTSVFFVC